MKEIMGKPMIAYTLERASKSRYIDQIILATSDSDKERPLVDYIEKSHYNLFRGDENNVLKRYAEAAKRFNGDVIIRITGDCPLIDPIIIDHAVTYFLSNSYDYIRLDVPETFIRGFDVEVFSRAALERVYGISQKLEGTHPYKEHVTLYMYQHPEEFHVGVLKGSPLYQKDYRLCVDTDEDFLLVTKIYDFFKDPMVNAEKVVKLLDDNPELAAINHEIKQKHE
jgi:spore coat polysaccharide biosynthesis protein SpsF